MALATTCPKCNTSFRVAPEQLASRRGMVRCGICQNVFSGMANLRHVDEILRPSRATATPPSSTRAAGSAAASVASSVASTGAAPAKGISGNSATARSKRSKDFEQTDLRTAFFLPETVFGPSTEMVAQGQEFVAPPTVLPSSLHNPSSLAASATASGDPSSNGTPSEAANDDREPIGLKQPSAITRNRWALENADGADTSPRPAAESRPMAEPLAIELPAPKPPDFARVNGRPTAAAEPLEADQAIAERAAAPSRLRMSKKRSSPARAARDRSDEAIAYFATEESSGGFTSRAVAFGWLGCLVAALLLAVQLVIAGRSVIAAYLPSLRAPLAALVSPLGIKVEPPRDLSALTIEAFELQAANTPGLLSVSALLRNRSSRGVFWPALEMTLTDGQGTLLVRKVLLPADYLPGVPADMRKDIERGVSPRAELALRLALEARDLVPTNYSVTLFYP